MKESLEYIVKVEDLTVAYDLKPVLWDIDLNIPKGKLMAIVGPNGAGKSTLIKAMLGLLKPVTGTVEFFPNEILDGKALKKRVGYVPQSGSVDWDFPSTVLDIVMMGRYGRLGWVKRPAREDREIAHKTIEKVGMTDYVNRQISQLSGGQQQRVFLARALVQEADIYLMDEPFKGVDAQTERAIVALLKDMKSQGKTVVVVHHDLQTVAEYFDWITLLNMRLVASGPIDETFTDECLRKAYHSNDTILRSRT